METTIKEEWRPVKGFEEFYEVSSLGRVRSLDRIYPDAIVNCKGEKQAYVHKGQMMKGFQMDNGYVALVLKGMNRIKRFLVHRLVADAFIENPDNFPQVNHKDECKTNNAAYNLEWCDGKYNTNYGNHLNKFLSKRGRTVKQYSLDGELIATYIGVAIAARETGLDRRCIAQAARKGMTATACGYRWQYVN